MPELAFRPSLHGWPFENRFRFPPHLLGASRPLPDTFGLCGGLCWTALDRFLAGRRIPRSCPAPKAGEPLHAELILRQANALSRDVWNRIRDLQQMPARSHAPGITSVESVMRREWRRLQDRLDAGEPTLLCIALETGRYASPMASHQVLAYGYTHDRDARRVHISVYDPNHPGDDDRALTLTLSRTGRPVESEFDGFGAVHGFVVVPYDRAMPPRLSVATFADPGRVTYNHPFLDRPTVVADEDGALDLVGRDADANLVRYRRDPDGAWARQNLTLETGAGADAAIHSRPMALGAGRGITIFARNAEGDLLQFRQHMARGWRVHNLTDDRKIGPDFRLAGDPVPIAGPGRRIGVLGVTPDGRLVHYEWATVRGWSISVPTAGAPSPDAFAVSGRPIPVIGPDDSLHVLARGGDGRLLHFRRSAADAGWSAVSVLDDAPANGRPIPDAPLRISGDPAVRADTGGVDAFARTAEGGLLHGRWTPDGGWSIAEIAASAPGTQGDEGWIESDPVVVAADDSLHIFARNRAGGLIHMRRTGEEHWTLEDVTHSRATIDKDLTLDDGPVACAVAGTLYVAGTRGRRLVLYSWRPEADWTAQVPAIERPDGFAACGDLERLVALADERGRGHVFATDADGTVVHFEAAPGDRPAKAHMDAGGRPFAPLAAPEPPSAANEAPRQAPSASADEPITVVPRALTGAGQEPTAVPPQPPPAPAGAPAASTQQPPAGPAEETTAVTPRPSVEPTEPLAPTTPPVAAAPERVPTEAPRRRPWSTPRSAIAGLPLLDEPEDDALGPEDLPILELAEENIVADGDRLDPRDPKDRRSDP